MNPLEIYAVVADPHQCKGCGKCEVACIASHNGLSLKDAMKARKTGIFTSRLHVVKTEQVKMPVQCHQCEHAPCARVCPTGTLVQVDGRVQMRAQFCAGCQLCMMVCPYGAISMSFLAKLQKDENGLHARRVAVRCDLCEDWRRQEGKEVTACVEACPTGALHMVTLEEFQRIHDRAEETVRRTLAEPGGAAAVG
ncbi:MAG: 4Fe-4S dicluster domain-containing protein [Desulfovibrionaceae bacterium]